VAFQELEKLHRLLDHLPKQFRVEKLGEVSVKKQHLPIYGVIAGSYDKKVPTLGLFGGVHGIEKIGSQMIINHLKYISKQIEWDESLADLLQNSRIVSIPIVNPGGMYLNSRSNPNGIDIMRNAPINADVKIWNLLAGHQLGPMLPWYRGNPFEKMEMETETLIGFVKREMLESEFSMSLDIHSGFGMKDRLWYPHSSCYKKFAQDAHITGVLAKFRESLPFNNYIIEPQSKSYLIHGDAWDYLYFEKEAELAQQGNSSISKGTFIPWTLELGSWSWIKKNPFQAFKVGGYFNPILPHRYDRVMRRHRALLDLFHKLTIYHKRWVDYERYLT